MNQPHLLGAQSSDKVTKNAWALSTALGGGQFPNKDVSTVAGRCQCENQGIQRMFDLDVHNFSITFPKQAMSSYGWE